MKNKNVKKLNLNFEKITISKLEQRTINGGVNNGKTDDVNVRPTEAGESCICTWNDAYGG